MREVGNVMSGRWGDDEVLLAEIREAARRAGPVPDAVRRTARTAYRFRSDDSDRVLATISYDSALDSAVTTRAGEEGGPRIVVFTSESRLSVEVEVTDDRVVGQLIPARAGAVAIMTVDGVVAEAVADSMGCFFLPRPLPGPVRFRCDNESGTVLTDWVRL
jgi:hypothetical protein